MSVEILKKQARLDVSSAPVPSKVQRTPQGGILAAATPTRCGVLVYTYPDGKVVRELRHPDEVFRADSLESLKGAPVTIGHPAEPVTSTNWKHLSVGTVGDDVHPEGIFVAARVRVQDTAAVARIPVGRQPTPDDLVEMSCGYDADVELTPGEYKGERYDAVQRNIRYNHVALGPRNWGRAGRDVGLRLDSAYSDSVNHTDQNDAPKEPTVVFDAKDFVSKADHDKVVGVKDAKIAELEATVTKQTKRADSAEALVKPEALDKLVNERQSIVDVARTVVGKDFKADGKSAHEIRLEVVKGARPSMKLDGQSEAYIAGVFEGIASKEKEAEASHEQVADTQVAQRKDSVGEKPDAHASMVTKLHGQFKENA